MGRIPNYLNDPNALNDLNVLNEMTKRRESVLSFELFEAFDKL
jgi:hypothetical protein